MQNYRTVLLLVLVISISSYTWIYLTTLTETDADGSGLKLNTVAQSSHRKPKLEPPFWRHGFDHQDREKENGSYAGFNVYSDNIENIRIVGERHSGTTFLTRYLKACFPTRSVGDFLVNGKHWFQPNPQYVEEMAQKYGKSGLSPTLVDDIDAQTWWQIAKSEDPKIQFNNTLVIAIFRNPYHWIEAMRRVPHHWPNHVELVPKNVSTLVEVNYTRQKEKGKRRSLGSNIHHGEIDPTDVNKSFPPKNRQARRLDGSIIQKSFVTATLLDWQDFVDRPLYLVDYQERDTGILCQKGFSFGTISPCDRDHSYVPEKIRHIPRSFLRNLPFEVDDVVYELDINGQPFQNIMQLRAAKINNFLNLAHDWNLGGFAAIRYEDIIGDKIAALVQKTESALHVESSCPKLESFYRKSYNLSNEFRSWITDQTDWKVEALVGYFPE